MLGELESFRQRQCADRAVLHVHDGVRLHLPGLHRAVVRAVLRLGRAGVGAAGAHHRHQAVGLGVAVDLVDAHAVARAQFARGDRAVDAEGCELLGVDALRALGLNPPSTHRELLPAQHRAIVEHVDEHGPCHVVASRERLIDRGGDDLARVQRSGRNHRLGRASRLHLLGRPAVLDDHMGGRGDPLVLGAGIGDPYEHPLSSTSLIDDALDGDDRLASLDRHEDSRAIIQAGGPLQRVGLGEVHARLLPLGHLRAQSGGELDLRAGGQPLLRVAALRDHEHVCSLGAHDGVLVLLASDLERIANAQVVSIVRQGDTAPHLRREDALGHLAVVGHPQLGVDLGQAQLGTAQR